ncbi:MAG: M48 family metalloprotease [Synechococcus sp. ELA057]
MPRGFRISQLLTAGSLALAAVLVAGVFWQRSRQDALLPAEYTQLEQVVQRLAAHNDLGRQPLSFSISAGSYAANLAQDRGLCKEERCDFYAQLDPFRHYDRSWDELMRQAYAIGDIEAWSASSGTVNLSRASFRTYGSRQGWLSCTVAHELAHLRRNHIFSHSYYVNNTLKGKADKQRTDLSYQRGRDQELEADSDSAQMLANSGLRDRICLANLIFLHKSAGDGSATEPDSTHPGYDDRIKAMTRVYAALEQAQKKVKRKSGPARQQGTPGSFRYDSEENLLIFTPRRS